MLEDVHAIRRLQHAYGYYLDKCLYDEVVDLFADDGEVRFMGGAFREKRACGASTAIVSARDFTGGVNGPAYGFLLDHPQLQDIIDVAADRRKTAGRFRYIMQAGSHESRPGGPGMLPQQWWEGGLYENEYVQRRRRLEDQGVRQRLRVPGHVREGLDVYAEAVRAAFRETFPKIRRTRCARDRSAADAVAGHGGASVPLPPSRHGKRWQDGEPNG